MLRNAFTKEKAISLLENQKLRRWRLSGKEMRNERRGEGWISGMHEAKPFEVVTAVCKNRRLCASFTEIIGFWPRTHLK